MTSPPVQRLTRTAGTRVVPALSDYDAVSPTWSECEYRAHLTDTNSVAGFWEGEPGWVAIDEWPYHEVCVILRGRVAIETPDGRVSEFGPGQAFAVPAGFCGIWHTLEHTEKIFVGVVTDSARRAAGPTT